MRRGRRKGTAGKFQGLLLHGGRTSGAKSAINEFLGGGSVSQQDKDAGQDRHDRHRDRGADRRGKIRQEGDRR